MIGHNCGGMIAWALPWGFTRLLQRGQEITAPTTLIWGDPDFALSTSLAEWSKDYNPSHK